MWNWLRLSRHRSRPVPDALWQSTLRTYPFLTADPTLDTARLREWVSQFLAQKTFTGAHGLAISDAMAVAIAAQACLPVLYLGLHWYDDFKGIVVHPGAMLAPREITDEAGVVHHFKEALIGEAMDGGPVTLSWDDVAAAEDAAVTGTNVVIHEFVHKLDMRHGPADGCPPLPSRAARQHWQRVMLAAYQRFQEQVIMAERFGAEPPWLDGYAASAPAEFFAVASEAYFVSRPRFAQEFPGLVPLFDRFFRPGIGPLD